MKQEPRSQDAKNQRKNTKEEQIPKKIQEKNFKNSPNVDDHLKFIFLFSCLFILGFLLPLFFGSWHLGFLVLHLRDVN